MVEIVEIHERAAQLPVIYLDQREPASLPEPHDGHGLCLEVPLARRIQLEAEVCQLLGSPRAGCAGCSPAAGAAAAGAGAAAVVPNVKAGPAREFGRHRPSGIPV